MNTTYDELLKISETKKEDINKSSFHISMKKYDKLVDVMFRLKCLEYIEDMSNAKNNHGEGEELSIAFHKFREFIDTKDNFSYEATYASVKEKIMNKTGDLISMLKSDPISMKKAMMTVNETIEIQMKHAYAKYCEQVNEFLKENGTKGFDCLYGYVEDNIQSAIKLSSELKKMEEEHQKRMKALEQEKIEKENEYKRLLEEEKKVQETIARQNKMIEERDKELKEIDAKNENLRKQIKQFEEKESKNTFKALIRKIFKKNKN